MPKTLLEKIVFTIIMAAIMVYGMIVYNVALNTGGVTNATLAMALHEMPIMVPAAFILEFFVVEKLATRLAFRFMRPAEPCHLPPAVPPGRQAVSCYAAILNLYYNYIRAVSQPRLGAASQPVRLYKFDIPDIQMVNNVPILPRF